MMQIGIDDTQNLVYEGSGRYGRAVWPAPVITPATFIAESSGPMKAEASGGVIESACLFREDSFDPISRIRRGRFYFRDHTQPAEWYVQTHPVFNNEPLSAITEPIRKVLYTFEGQPILPRLPGKINEQPLVLLGVGDRFSTWTIINIETISTREDLVTLKGRSSFGVLPVVDDSKIPNGVRALIRESLSAFVDEVHRSAPISVIDRARETVVQCLSVYLEIEDEKALDLAELIKLLEKSAPPKYIAANTSKIINLLHSRGKHAVKARYKTRDIREQDAELAMQCVGTVLCEIGWADWA